MTQLLLVGKVSNTGDSASEAFDLETAELSSAVLTQKEVWFPFPPE